MYDAQRASGLTRQLLTFSRKGILQRRPVDLNTVILEMARMLRRLTGQHITMGGRPSSRALPVRTRRSSTRADASAPVSAGPRPRACPSVPAAGSADDAGPAPPPP